MFALVSEQTKRPRAYNAVRCAVFVVEISARKVVGSFVTDYIEVYAYARCECVCDFV